MVLFCPTRRIASFIDTKILSIDSFNWEKSVCFNSISDNSVDVSKSLVYYHPVSHTSVMMRKKALQDNGGYNEARKDLFDWDLYVRLAASGHRIAKLSFPLIAKRRHPNQFFEGRERWKYVFSSLMLQMQAALLLNNSLLPVFFMPSLFCYRLLPGSMRMVVRRQLKLTLRKLWKVIISPRPPSKTQIYNDNNQVKKLSQNW